MATANRYDTGSKQALETTSLNSLGAGASVLGSTVYDNSNGYFWGDFELNVTYGTAPTVGKIIELWLVPAEDGTNYADGGASVAADVGLRVGGVAVRAVNTAQRLVFRNCLLPPCKFKVLLKNGGDQAFPASGSTLDLYPFSTKAG